MASWRFAVGNLVSRAPAPPAAVSPAAADADLVLANLGSGYPDQQGALQWRSDGTYALDFDLNLLATSSSRADAPTGWADLLNILSGAPGLSAHPPDWGTYAGRTALRLYRPEVQDVEVMPGETVMLTVGLYEPAASAATGCRVRVTDLWSGLSWDGAAWVAGGVVDLQSVDDTWKDVAEEITPAAGRAERSTYRVTIEPVAGAYDATTYVYASGPALFAAVDLCGVIGHNLDAAAVTLVPQPSGTTLTLTPAQPSMYVVGAATQLIRTWRLTIQMPAGNAPRPILGEVWIGTLRTMLVGSPVPTFGGEESSPGQIRVEGPRKRVEVVPDDARAVTSLDLAFLAPNDATFLQIRDEIVRLTRFGADPVLLVPGDRFEGIGRMYHGRIEDRVSWEVEPVSTGSAWSFGMPFTESPFAAP
jgi:hypothetical protein